MIVDFTKEIEEIRKDGEKLEESQEMKELIINADILRYYSAEFGFILFDYYPSGWGKRTKGSACKFSRTFCNRFCQI